MTRIENVILLFMAAIAWALAATMLVILSAIALQELHAGASVRAALSYDCPGARAEAAKAGRVPWDAEKLCPELAAHK